MPVLDSSLGQNENHFLARHSKKGIFLWRSRQPLTLHCKRPRQCLSNSKLPMLTWIELVEAYAEFAKARKELYFNRSMNSIVNALISSWLDVAIGLANPHDLCNLPPIDGI